MIWILAAMLIGLSPHMGMTQDRRSPHMAEGQLLAQKNSPSAAAEPKSLAANRPGDVPVYKPPKRGSPIGRVAGGTRGVNNGPPLLSALAPDHIGFSVHAQPTLYWYLSEGVSYPIEFTLIETIGPSSPCWSIVCLRTNIRASNRYRLQTIASAFSPG